MKNSESQMQEVNNNKRLLLDEDLDMFEDIEIQELERVEATEKVGNERKRKNPSIRSSFWKEYTVVTVEEGNPPQQIRKGKCNRCGKLIAAHSRNGTTGLKNHSASCLRKHEATRSQAVLNYQPSIDGIGLGTLTSWKFDQQACRMSLCKMIILDELPFRFVEREGFKQFMESTCPLFKIPSRHTIRADCVKLFMERKTVMKSFFKSKGMGRVSITTDCWTAINNTNFICVTAHCIDRHWKLHKKIISFRKIYSHKGDDLGASVISVLEEWGLENVLCCTMDNASANDVAIRYMKPSFEKWNTSVAGGKYLHLRCVAHIINLVVSDGLEEIGLSVRRVREAVKWIKASPARVEGFKTCINAAKVDCTKSLCLDVPTRWNSTYLMLESAMPYEKAMKFFATLNIDFIHDLNQKKYKDGTIGVPDDQDWLNVKRMCHYLEKFYDLTLLVSGTTYVTSHLFFKEMCDVFDLITQLEKHNDDEISNMAIKMKIKLGKYWLEDTVLNPKMNKMLYIAALLDPRQKMKHVEKCLKTVYGDSRATELVGEVNSSLNELFEFYKKHMTLTSTPTSMANTSISNCNMGQPNHSGLRGTGSCSLVGVISEDEEDDSDMSEITIYFTEKQYRVPSSDVHHFDILQWWSKHGPRFPVLSEMARDILAIPISSVASEAAFSTGGRVLSQFRSSLTSNMVEALICAEDWLKSSGTFLKDEEDTPETELEKEYESVLTELGFGGGGSKGDTSTMGSANN